MKSTKFITELRARGLQITENEAKYLMEIAVADYRENQVKPILKRENMAHYMIMALSYCMGLRKEQLSKKHENH